MGPTALAVIVSRIPQRVRDSNTKSFGNALCDSDDEQSLPVLRYAEVPCVQEQRLNNVA